MTNSAKRSLADRFRERFEKAHSQSRPLIIDWELAVEVRNVLDEIEKPGVGMPGYIHPNCDCVSCTANRLEQAKSFDANIGAFAAAAGNWLAQEMIYAVDPLCEEAAQALERRPDETDEWRCVECHAELPSTHSFHTCPKCMERLSAKASERQPCKHGNASGHCERCLDAL